MRQVRRGVAVGVGDVVVAEVVEDVEDVVVAEVAGDDHSVEVEAAVAEVSVEAVVVAEVAVVEVVVDVDNSCTVAQKNTSRHTHVFMFPQLAFFFSTH